MLGILASDAEGLHGRSDVAVVDLGWSRRLGTFASALLRDVPPFRAFEHLHPSQHAQWVDAAASAKRLPDKLRPTAVHIYERVRAGKTDDAVFLGRLA